MVEGSPKTVGTLVRRDLHELDLDMHAQEMEVPKLALMKVRFWQYAAKNQSLSGQSKHNIQGKRHQLTLTML